MNRMGVFKKYLDKLINIYIYIFFGVELFEKLAGNYFLFPLL